MDDKHYGVYRATVVNNTDPQQDFRLLLSIRDVSEAPPLWAEVCVPVGEITLPGIGDTVFVMFEAGDVQRPIWVGVRPRRSP